MERATTGTPITFEAQGASEHEAAAENCNSWRMKRSTPKMSIRSTAIGCRRSWTGWARRERQATKEAVKEKTQVGKVRAATAAAKVAT